MKKLFYIFLLTSSLLAADIKKGKKIFKKHCSVCHGANGAGGLGLNLTDDITKHGATLDAIKNIISNGVPTTTMMPFKTSLNAGEIDNVSAFVKSLIGKNLKPQLQTAPSNVTPFPEGSEKLPLLIRTFMPNLNLDKEVFKNHGTGKKIYRYDINKPLKKNQKKIDKTIDGIPASITVNFGKKLSYCFDTTECRLLYIWHGKFLDMTNYWGKESGNERESFGYLPKVLGTVTYKAQGSHPIKGKVKFKGYKKINNVPELMYQINDIDFTLTIMPKDDIGTALCTYTSNTKKELKLKFKNMKNISCNKGKIENNTLILTKEEAQQFTITIKGK